MLPRAITEEIYIFAVWGPRRIPIYAASLVIGTGSPPFSGDGEYISLPDSSAPSTQFFCHGVITFG